MATLTKDEVHDMTANDQVENAVLLFDEMRLDEIYIVLTRALNMKELEELASMMTGH